MHIATENKLVHTKQTPDHIPTSNRRYNPDIDATLHPSYTQPSVIDRVFFRSEPMTTYLTLISPIVHLLSTYQLITD